MISWMKLKVFIATAQIRFWQSVSLCEIIFRIVWQMMSGHKCWCIATKSISDEMDECGPPLFGGTGEFFWIRFFDMALHLHFTHKMPIFFFFSLDAIRMDPSQSVWSSFELIKRSWQCRLYANTDIYMSLYHSFLVSAIKRSDWINWRA